MSESPKRGPRPAAQEKDIATIPSDPELGSAPTVVANTVAVEGKPAPKKLDPFTLVSGESISPQVDAHAEDFERTGGAARYERGPVIGAGGMGEVRLHADRRIGRRVAKKTLHGTLDSGTARQRFVREARIQGQLEHPAIVPVYDLDVDEEGRAFFTMKRVRGVTLDRVLERLRAKDEETERRFSLRKLLTAFTRVCLAVDYAHTRGVLHRDLKPGNVMLGDFGEVYVLDWGLAKVVGEIEDSADDPPESAPVIGVSTALTRGGALLGTPAYMAPEQLLRKDERIDARSDVFALGAILFEILTRAPFRKGADVAEIVKRLPGEATLRPSDLAPDVAPELDDLCARAIAFAPENRPARARDLAEGVERYLDGEQDQSLRRELSARHAADARGRAKDKRVEALRETLKALTLDADNTEAQTLLVELLTDTSGAVPKEAEPALQEQIDHSRASAARASMWGLVLWLAVFPFVVLIGVRSWPAVLTTAGLTTASVLFTFWMSRLPRYDLRHMLFLAAVLAGVTASTSCYMGPFAVVTTCSATVSMLFGMHASRRERPLTVAIVTIGGMAPFLVEQLGIFPRAYAFEADRIVVFARAIALPEGATTAVMAYSTLTFTACAGLFMGRMRDSLRALEQRNFLQAWYLRELFPGAAGPRKLPPPA